MSEQMRFPLPRRLPLVLVFLLLGLPMPGAADVTLTRLDGKVRVEIDGQLFAEYRHGEYDKPILYPLIGPQGAPMTRDYPRLGAGSGLDF